MTYALLAIPFLAVALAIGIGAAVWARRKSDDARVSLPAIGITFVILMVLTAIFDNVIIAVGLVAYDDATLTGIMIGVAPIEDFAYSIAGIIMLPSVWVLSLVYRERRSA